MSGVSESYIAAFQLWRKEKVRIYTVPMVRKTTMATRVPVVRHWSSVVTNICQKFTVGTILQRCRDKEVATPLPQKVRFPSRCPHLHQMVCRPKNHRLPLCGTMDERIIGNHPAAVTGNDGRRIHPSTLIVLYGPHPTRPWHQ